MEWQFASPAPALTPFLGSYYLATTRHLTVDDLQRADTGHLHFFLEGSGYKDFPGIRRQANLVSLSGPSSIYQGYALNGPARLFGISLLPRAWDGIVPCPADSLSDRGCNAVELFGPSVLDLHHKLRGCETLAAMAPIADAFFQQRSSRMAKGPDSVVEGIRIWLSEALAPDLAHLHDRFDLSDRQLARISNRYWGAPPKSLARKYAALRTASLIIEQDGVPPPEALRHYADPSHLIREVKRVTGQTPRQLRTQASPILRTALHPSNLWELQDRGCNSD
jgi:AraC-like DNA-binding protein